MVEQKRHEKAGPSDGGAWGFEGGGGGAAGFGKGRAGWAPLGVRESGGEGIDLYASKIAVCRYTR